MKIGCVLLAAGAGKRFGGGKLLYQSPVLKSANPVAFFEVPVSGLQELELKVRDAGDGISCDHADWVNPELR